MRVARAILHGFLRYSCRAIRPQAPRRSQSPLAAGILATAQRRLWQDGSRSCAVVHWRWPSGPCCILAVLHGSSSPTGGSSACSHCGLPVVGASYPRGSGSLQRWAPAPPAAQRRLTVTPPGAWRPPGRLWCCLSRCESSDLRCGNYTTFCVRHDGTLPSPPLTQ